MTVNQETFKAVMGQWPSGVTVITSLDDEGLIGMTASSFSSVSLEPPLVSICVARHLVTHARLEKAGVFAVNILSKDQVDDGLRFAGMLPDVEDRFEGIDTTTAVTGSPLLARSLGWVDCKLWASHDGGDHTIFVGEVVDAGVDKTAAPLLYHSRSWGQFADVLAGEVHITRPTAAGVLSVDDAFGTDPANPDNIEVIVKRVSDVLRSNSAPQLLVLNDARAVADPLLVRLSLQGIGGLVGKTAVALRPGTGPMALANVLTALKSGVHHLLVAESADEPYLNEADLRLMLDRMGVAIHD